MFKKIIQWNLAHRWFVLGFFLLITLLAATQLPKLRFEFSPEAMLEFSDEEIAYQAAFNEKFKTNPNVFLVVFSHPETLLEAEQLKDLRELTSMLEEIEGIEGTYSLARVPDSQNAGPMALIHGLSPIVPAEGELTADQVELVKSRVAGSNLLRGNLISEDGKYALITATLKDGYYEPNDFYPVSEKVKESVAKWQTNDNNGVYSVSYGGLPYIRAVTVDTMERDQLMLWPIVALLYVAALILVFRSFWQAIMPLLCIGCVIVWAIAIMVLWDMPVTMINNTLPLLILVIGVTNGIYVVMRMLDERRKGKPKDEAITSGVYRVALATLLTTATTSIGFGSLLIAKTDILNGYGSITALAVMLIYVAIIFMMPQVISFIKLEPRKGPAIDEARENGLIERVLLKLTDFTIKYRKAVIISAVILLIACLAVASHIRFDSKVNDVFQDDHPITVTNSVIEEKLGGMLPVEIDIWAEEEQFFRKVENLTTVCRLQKEINNVAGILSSISICNMLEEGGIQWDAEEAPTQAALSGLLIGIRNLQKNQYEAYMTEQGNNMHISLRIPDNGYENSKKIIANIRTIVESKFAGTSMQYRFTGIGYNSTLGLDHFMTDLFSSLLTAFLIIFGLLFIAFRSFSSGVVAILPNLIPISMTLAFLPLYGYNLNTTSVLVFTISIGLAVDNSIHIITRFRQEYRGDRSVNDALRLAMKSSGRAILQSNVMLCSGLAVLALSDFDPILRVGVLVITTIGAALIVTMIVLPAEIACIGHRMRLPRFARELKTAKESSKEIAPEKNTPEESTSEETT